MSKNILTVQEKAVAVAAITARHAADVAKTAHEAAPDDASLKEAYTKADQAALTAEAAAEALSQTPKLTPEQIAKKKRKIAIIQSELREAGAVSEDDDEEDEDEDDDDAPVTRGDLKRIRADEAKQTAIQMAGAIQDVAARTAVEAALNDVVPSGNPEVDFKKAVAIANIDRNDKILSELGRKPPVVQHRTGSGAPPTPPDAEFVPTPQEASYMRKFNMTKQEILNARAGVPNNVLNQS